MKSLIFRNLLAGMGFYFLSMNPGFGAVVTEEVIYQDAQGTELKGYLAYDDAAADRRPGVIIVHEWWGHNDYVRRRAEMLAGMGYVAFALDMYGGGKLARHPEDAGAFAGEVRKNLDLMKTRFLAALEHLKKDPRVDAKKIAAIGYCFGGSTVLQMAREGVDLRGVVSFHGALDTENPARAGKVKAKILVLHGGADSMITVQQVDAFKKEMDASGADYKVIVYDGAKHSFTNPGADRFAQEFGIALGYDPEADKKSWQEMKRFFEEIFA